MSKYLIYGSYTTEGVKGVLKEGGTARRNAAEQALKSVGGKLESFYFAFGADDVFAIVDLPDAASAAGASLVINASGAINLKTVVLITPEEMDQATKTGVSYRPPGG
jgi:uncharacterized protein with GYD domain